MGENVVINLLSLFSGIGAFERALQKLNIPYNLINYCEIDKNPALAYSILHNVSQDKNLGDITKITDEQLEQMGDVDLLTYGFPCTDISLAGYQKGLSTIEETVDEVTGETITKEVKTRSGLVWDAHRIIGKVKPKVALCENVKNLTSKKFAKEFEAILYSLEEMGYNNYWKILNSKHFGIPQNRERVFIVSIRKDVDDGTFEFPTPIPLELRLKDILDAEVDEKYYIKKALNIVCREHYIQWDNSGKGHNSEEFRGYYLNEVAPTVPSYNSGDKVQVVLKNKEEFDTECVINVGNVNPSGKGQNGNDISVEGIARTVTIEKGEGQKVLVAGLNLEADGSDRTIKANYQQTSLANLMRQGTFGSTGVLVVGNYSPSNHEASRIDNPAGIAPCVKENHGTVTGVLIKTNNAKGYDIAEEGDYVDTAQPSSTTRRGRVGHGVAQCLDTSANNHCVVVPCAYDARNDYIRKDGCVGALCTDGSSPRKQNQIIVAGRLNSSQDGIVDNPMGISPTHTAGHFNQPKILCENLRIRKLTPFECLKLMGFEKADGYKLQEMKTKSGKPVLSNSSLYKMAGNSIVVDVLMHIFRKLYNV